MIKIFLLATVNLFVIAKHGVIDSFEKCPEGAGMNMCDCAWVDTGDECTTTHPDRGRECWCRCCCKFVGKCGWRPPQVMRRLPPCEMKNGLKGFRDDPYEGDCKYPTMKPNAGPKCWCPDGNEGIPIDKKWDKDGTPDGCMCHRVVGAPTKFGSVNIDMQHPDGTDLAILDDGPMTQDLCHRKCSGYSAGSCSCDT